MDVTHLNKYGDLLWAGQDVSGKACPSLFFPFPAHALPLQCKAGLFLRSWRPAENHISENPTSPNGVVLPACSSGSWVLLFQQL